jgi:adenine deaminase
MTVTIKAHEQRGRAMFKVYYDTPSARPYRHFSTREAAIDWATKRVTKNPEVVEVVETTIWSWRDKAVQS